MTHGNVFRFELISNRDKEQEQQRIEGSLPRQPSFMESKDSALMEVDVLGVEEQDKTEEEALYGDGESYLDKYQTVMRDEEMVDIALPKPSTRNLTLTICDALVSTGPTCSIAYGLYFY